MTDKPIVRIKKEGWALGPSRSEVMAECVVYAPTYLLDDRKPDPTGEASLFVRRYRLLRLPPGSLVVRWAPNVLRFEDDDRMVAHIEADNLTEMPSERPSGDWLPGVIVKAIESEKDSSSEIVEELAG